MIEDRLKEVRDFEDLRNLSVGDAVLAEFYHPSTEAKAEKFIVYNGTRLGEGFGYSFIEEEREGKIRVWLPQKFEFREDGAIKLDGDDLSKKYYFPKLKIGSLGMRKKITYESQSKLLEEAGL